MKTFNYLLVSVVLLFFNACSNNDSSVVTPYEKTDAGSKGKVVETAVLTKGTPTPLFTKYDLARYGLPQTKTNESKNGAARPAVTGPFTVSGNLRQIFSLRKMVLGSNQSVYPAGVYFCDVYICDYVQTLPSGQFAGLYSASLTGYTDFSTQQSGVNSIQVINSNNTSTYTFSTYSVVPVYNVSGQYIYAGTIPQDLTGLTYTYGIFP